MPNLEDKSTIEDDSNQLSASSETREGEERAPTEEVGEVWGQRLVGWAPDADHKN